MTTLPPNYLRLSSKWLETNPLPEDGLLLEADDTWKPSSQRGRITATPGFDYATAQTDLPREAYADSDDIRPMTHEERKAMDEFTMKELTESNPAPDLTQPGLPKAGLTQPGDEVASERAEEKCPYCGDDPVDCLACIERDRRQANETIATLRAQLEAKEGEVQNVLKGTSEVINQRDKLRAELQKWQREWRGLRDAVLRQDNAPVVNFANVELEANRMHEKNDKLRAEGEEWKIVAKQTAKDLNARLAVTSADLDAIARQLARRPALDGFATTGEKISALLKVAAVNDPKAELAKALAEVERLKAQVERKSDAALGYAQENTRLTAEVEHRTKQRDEFQNLFIEASDGFNQRGEQLARLTAELDAVRKENDWRKTTLKNREETLNKVSNDVVIARTERDAAQARCGELERGVTRIASMEPHQHSTTCMEMHRIATALLTPSQQPDNFDSSGGESRTAIAGADGSKHTEGDCNPQGSESRKANPKIASESSASPAVNPSRPEPVKAGEWLPMEAAPKRKVRLRIQTSPDAFRTVEALWINGQWDFDGMLFFKPVGWKPIAPEEA